MTVWSLLYGGGLPVLNSNKAMVIIEKTDVKEEEITGRLYVRPVLTESRKSKHQIKIESVKATAYAIRIDTPPLYCPLNTAQQPGSYFQPDKNRLRREPAFLWTR